MRDPLSSTGLLLAGGLIDLMLAAGRGSISRFLLTALAGGLGNGLVLLLKLLMGQVPRAVLTQGLPYAFVTYIGFGLAGGLVAALALIAARSQKSAS